jgi:UDP-N-acetylmuramoylalanine--D-glutamate ligase
MAASARPPLPPGPYLVLGLARSGEAAAIALRARGETVIGVDAGDPRQQPALAAAARRLRDAGVEVHLDGPDDGLAAAARTLIKSPGVPRSAPLVQRALGHGIPVMGELELAWRLLPNDFIAVTGTNGKTTTTEWIGHIHRTAGEPVAVAGNVGTALSTLVGAVPATTTIVAESSSFQLEDTLAFAPEVALLLNITPDHLDRHGRFEDYVAAKLRAFANQGPDDFAVTPEDFTTPVGGHAKRIRFGAGEDCELQVQGGEMTWRGRVLTAIDRIGLPGVHNLQNAMAAATACLARGLPQDAVTEGLQTFAGVSHRLELVAQTRGVSFVNDSKATNVASTVVALRSYPSGVHLILGGQGKGQDFTPLTGLIEERCTAVYLIGQDADLIAAAIDRSSVPIAHAGTLERAVELAAAAARAGEVVLLSPACASFDQYRDFEERGERFRELASIVTRP